MSSNWPTVKTGEIFDLINGFAFKSKEFCEHGAPVLKIKNVKAGYLSLDNLAYVDPIYLSKKSDKVAQKNDLLITMSGNRHDGSMETWVGKVSWFNENKLYLINQRVGILRLKEGLDINPRYMAYQLSSVEFQKHFIAVATSSGGQANLSPDQIKQTELSCPPRNIQDEIVNQIGSLEDKAKINSDTNHTLEQIAQALFKSWFVDFDPVKAKIETLAQGGSAADAELAAMSAISAKTLDELHGLKANNSEAFNKLAQTAALFPAAMQDSELGEIPEGWEVKQLSEICQVINGRAYKNTEFKTEGTPIVRIQNLSNRGKTVYSDLELPPEKYIDREDFIYAWSATFGPHIWRGPKSIYHYHIWKMEVDESVISRYFLYLSMFRKTEAMKNAGTGSIFTHLTKKIMESQHVLIGDQAINNKFSDIIVPIFDQISSLKSESTHLADIRDALLPKLLIGNGLTSEVECV